MREVTYLEALKQGLWEEMERDPRVFLIGEDIGAYGGAFKVTEGFQSHFGDDRVIDTPISEIAIVGVAAGAAHLGMRPVCEMQFIDFIRELVVHISYLMHKTPSSIYFHHQLALATIERLKPPQPYDSTQGTRDVINAAIDKALAN